MKTIGIGTFALLLLFISCEDPVRENGGETSIKQLDTSQSNPIPMDQTVDDTLRSKTDTVVTAVDTLPAPGPSSTKFSKVIGWAKDQTPLVPKGFTVTKYAENLDNPRWLYELPNGDVLVAEANTEVGFAKKAVAVVTGKSKSLKLGKSANRITLLRDSDHDGLPEVKETFLEGLHQPLGMLLIGNVFYVANTDAVVSYPYSPGQTKITNHATTLFELPAGGYNNHWTRNLTTNASKSKLYISVGSGSNVAEHGLENELFRADILEIGLDGTAKKVFASGLRNPVGMDWEPNTQKLWTVVNERDMLGDHLVPDYLTQVKENGFYGWPWYYWGNHPDPRMKKQPQPIRKAIVPDVDLGAHTASLGLAFYKHTKFPEKYRNGAFIGQHGSWNSSTLVGYKVVFVPFRNGKPVGPPEDFLTGFVSDQDKGEVHGRPVGVLALKNGSLLVADDAANVIWKITAQ